MRKIINFIAVVLFCVLVSSSIVMATDIQINSKLDTALNSTNIAPEYDSDFDSSNGIFYANGNPITIDKDKTTLKTMVYWNGGQQEIKDTVKVVAGGKEGTDFKKSNIIMNGGTVKHLYGGGISLDETKIAKVEDSTVTVTGGIVTGGVYGGGLIYSQVDTSNVIINGGTIAAVAGGGAANTVIAGTSYSAGTEAEPQNSKNRVDTANTQINGGTIDSTPSNYGIIIGAGQGYSFVDTANLKIFNGELSKTYVTSAGSNGYTKEANTTIAGGNILLFQTVNRGTLKKAKVRIDGGIIESVFVGGEVAADVNGKVEKVDLAILGGKVGSFQPGTNNAQTLEVEQENYKAVFVDGTVTESRIGRKEVKIDFEIDIIENSIVMLQGETRNLETKVTTTPIGYENLFENETMKWKSSDETIVTAEQTGTIKAIKSGNVIVTAQMIEKQDNVEIQVQSINFIIIFAIIIVAIVIFALIYLAIRVCNIRY